MDLPQLDGVTHRTVVARGLRFHVAEAGAGAPIVLVHGWPQHWWMWRRVVPLLAPHARLVMIDLRGFGWSDAPPGRYDKQMLADDLLAVLDALGLQRVRLMAHDWGAWSGFLACLAAPERFEAFLALGAPRPAGGPSARRLREVWRFAYQVAIAAPLLGRRLVANPRFIERTIMAGTVQRDAFTPYDLRAFTAPLAEPARARASVRLYRTFLMREVARSPRGRLRVPTRIMVGDRDPAIPAVLLEGAERDADELAVEIVADCGHFVPEEHPELVAERARVLFGLQWSEN
jgi:pimeloyl-ACP methyl ester carboxylesterase